MMIKQYYNEKRIYNFVSQYNFFFFAPWKTLQVNNLKTKRLFIPTQVFL